MRPSNNHIDASGSSDFGLANAEWCARHNAGGLYSHGTGQGVGEEEVYWSHAFRNALFPIITVFASVLPAVFTGSLVVEALFGFPGMGNKTFEAYLGKDLPLLSAIMMVAATLTILGSLLADLLYAWADPRVRFSKENG